MIVEQLLPLVRELRDQGTTVILVEQSVNLALTVAETAYFMEKGEIRFPGRPPSCSTGPTSCARCSSRAPGTAGGRRGAAPGEPARAKAAGQRRRRRKRPPSGRRRSQTLRRSPGPSAASGPSTTSPSASRPGEIVGIIGPNGAGKTTLFDLISGFTPADGGQSSSAATTSPGSAPTSGPAAASAARSRTPACSRPSPSRRRWPSPRALGRRRKDPLSAALHLPARFDSEEQVAKRVDELIELLGLGAFRTKFVRELSTGSRRIVDLACVVAHRPTVVLLDEPSSGIAQRETEALARCCCRIRDGLGAALVVIEHDMPLVTVGGRPPRGHGPGAGHRRGPARRGAQRPVVVASYLGTNDDAIARSGASADP